MTAVALIYCALVICAGCYWLGYLHAQREEIRRMGERIEENRQRIEANARRLGP